MGGGMMRAKAETVAGALRMLSSLIEAPDDIPAMALQEGAQLIDDLSALSLEMLAMLRHDTALPKGCPACAMKARLKALRVESE